MKTNSDELNLKLWNAAKDGDNDAVITAIAAGADVNWKNDSYNGYTPLHIACWKRHDNIVLVLLQNKANPNLQDKNGNAPLHLACQEGYESIVLVLLQNKADPNLQNEWTGQTPLYKACEKGYESIVLVLLQNKADPNLQDENGYTSLNKACEKGHESTVLVLLQNGANPDLQDKNGYTPLHRACDKGHENIVLLLLQNKTNPNLQNKYDLTPLHMACEKGHENIVLVLLQNKANPNLQNKGGDTPLHWACEFGHESTVLVLLQNKANPDLQDKGGQTPLHRACEKGYESTVLVLLQNKADPNLQNENGETSLYLACEKGNENIVRILLENKANPNLSDKFEKKPLRIVFESSYCEEKQKKKIVKILLEAMHSTEGAIGSSLHYASLEGDLDIVKYVYSKNELNKQIESTGDTPLHCAIMNRHLEVVKFLFSNGANRNIRNKEEQKVFAINDNAKGGIDRLGFKAYAKAIYTVVNQATPSLCVGINAEWGSGKSFLIEEIKREFDPTVQLRISNSELVQWYEDEFNNSKKCKPLQQNDHEIYGDKQPDSEKITIHDVWDCSNMTFMRRLFVPFDLCYIFCCYLLTQLFLSCCHRLAQCYSIEAKNEDEIDNYIFCWDAMKFRFDLFRKYCLDPLRPTLLKIFLPFLKIYTFATIVGLVYDDVKLILTYVQFIYNVLYECIRLRKSRRGKWFNFFSDEEDQLFKSNLIEYIIIQFDSWLFKQSDELWAALIRELYKKVELRLSKHNSEEYFTSHPNELRADSKDYLSKWRIRKAADLLVKKYGGMNKLRVRLYGLIVFFLGALGTSVLSGLGYINIWTQVIHEARQIWILVMSVAGVILAIIPSLSFLYNTNQNAETSRGDSIYEEAKDLKDKIGFMGRVRQELDDLFGFMRAYKDETNIELRILIFVDDLDRCIEEGRNVKFLEAIQLMLNISGAPIVVFLAIDSRIVVASIEATVSKSLNLQNSFITGFEYLEKIIQLSFCLPPPSSEKIKSYIDYCVRSPDVDINYVARKIKALLTAFKDMKEIYPEASYFLECNESFPSYAAQKNQISYDDIESIIDEKDTVTLIKGIAKLLNHSTKQAAAKFENIGIAGLDDLLHSLLGAISTVAIIYDHEDKASKLMQISSVADKQTTKSDILRFLKPKQLVKSNFNLEMTKTLQKINQDDALKRKKMEDSLDMCSKQISRSPNALLPKDVVDLVVSLNASSDINARSVKRTLNELMIIFQVAKYKAIDEADPDNTIIYFDEWTELSKRLTVWILLCTMFPYRISFLIHRTYDFIQKQSLNKRSTCNNYKSSNDNVQSVALLYGSNEDDCAIPDIEKIPISMFYAEHVEPYIYTIKSAERLLRLDGDPDDFILILNRMTYDENDEYKLPSILCGDILGKLVSHETNETHNRNEKKSIERLKHASSERDDDVTKEEEMDDKSNDDVGDIGCHYDGEPSITAASHPMMRSMQDNRKMNNQINERYSNSVHRKENEAQHMYTTNNDDTQTNDEFLVARIEKKNRLDCLALITYSLNLNPSIRKQISMEMSLLTTDRELHIRSTRALVDKVPQLSSSLPQPPPLPSIQPSIINKGITSQSSMYDEKSVVFASTHSRDPTSMINQTQEITTTERRMEATFTNVLSSRKVQMKKDVVMEGRSYNILKKNH